MAHLTKLDPDRLTHILGETISKLHQDCEVDLDLLIQSHKPKRSLSLDKWVLDTNSVYRQKPGENYNSIAPFLLSNTLIFGKEVIVPWNVMCEINSHKDSNSSSTKNASKQGIKNLKMLELLYDYGFLELNVESIPTEIDNSVLKEAGATDLKIMDRVPKDGILLTSDSYLTHIAEIMGVNTENIENISGLPETDETNPYWEVLKKKLSQDGPIKYDEAIRLLNEKRSEDAKEASESDPEKLLEEKIRKKEIIRFVEDGSSIIALSRETKIIPTFDLINEIVEKCEEYNGDRYLSENILEKMRKSIGGTPTTSRPNLVFIIPSEYVYKSSEIRQIDALEELYNIKNCDMNTINPDSNNKDSIENSMIHASIESNCPIVCSPEEDTRKFRLLDLDFYSVDLDR